MCSVIKENEYAVTSDLTRFACRDAQKIRFTPAHALPTKRTKRQSPFEGPQNDTMFKQRSAPLLLDSSSAVFL
jgi:hypothetical protein